jgi:lysophospholipid acyltransferase (LPLAT)-like uncharacterized protein
MAIPQADQEAKSPHWKLRLVAWLGAWVIHFWCCTLRIRIRYPVDPQGTTVDLTQRDFVLALWHDSLLIPLWLLPRLRWRPTVLISKSGDGELVTQVCLHSGWKVVRGSSSRGGQEALDEATRLYRPGEPFRFIFTVDGPRGPRRHCKFGVVALASRLGLPVLPIGIHFENAWQVRSWDRMSIPKPFSRVEVVLDQWVAVPPQASSTELESARSRVEQMMFEVEARATGKLPPASPSTSAAG